MSRSLVLSILVVLAVALFLPIDGVLAQSNTFTITGAVPTFCSINNSPEAFSFNISYDWPGGPLDLAATVMDPGSTGLVGTGTASVAAGSGTTTVLFTLPTSATLPVATPWEFTVRVVGSLNGKQTWQAEARISCPAGGFPYSVTELSNGPVKTNGGGGGGDGGDSGSDGGSAVVEPGCDVQVAIPATAAVGTFGQNTTVYWHPGLVTNPPVVIEAGRNAWTLGLDSSGQFRKILWSCDFLWVPADSMGPDYDAPWTGMPLPVDVVQ